MSSALGMPLLPLAVFSKTPNVLWLSKIPLHALTHMSPVLDCLSPSSAPTAPSNFKQQLSHLIFQEICSAPLGITLHPG